MTKVKCIALSLEVLSVEVNLLLSLVFKDYVYALDHQICVLKSFHLSMNTWNRITDLSGEGDEENM